ncbi:MAG: hypothetical protein KGK07_05580 [Chloroflexota bacterium]|nr:hypothetical protein [Chloroflexota bacterium]
MDALGDIEALQTYWPYDAVRAGSTYSQVSQTDKLFTGQPYGRFRRQEPGDPAALGLYDYRARFYSTLVGGS